MRPKAKAAFGCDVKEKNGEIVFITDVKPESELRKKLEETKLETLSSIRVTDY